MRYRKEIAFAPVGQARRAPDDQPQPKLLDQAEEAADRVRAAEHDLGDARDELVRSIRRARDEGIPFALIARRVGLSRERVRQLYAGTMLSLVAVNGERVAHRLGELGRWYIHSPF